MAIAVKRFTQILSDMLNYLIATQSKLTDFNEGSIIRSFCEAIAREIEQLYIKGRVSFTEGLQDLPASAFNFSKQEAQAAAGEVVFSRTGTVGTLTIPIGTLLATSDGTQFTLVAVATITNGNTDSAATAVTAVKAGRDGNVPADSIVTIITPVVGIDMVANAAGTTGGQDEESDTAFFTRFQQYIAGLGRANEEGLLTGAKGVTGVRSASVIEHFPPSSGFHVTVYIDDGAGNASAALVAEVLSILTGDGTSSNPGYKAAGVNLQVLAPTAVDVAVEIELVSDNSVPNTILEYQVKQTIMDYINNLWIGQDVIRNRIIDNAMSISGISDIVLTLPAANVSIGGGQIARIADYDITVSFA